MSKIAFMSGPRSIWKIIALVIFYSFTLPGTCQRPLLALHAKCRTARTWAKRFCTNSTTAPQISPASYCYRRSKRLWKSAYSWQQQQQGNLYRLHRKRQQRQHKLIHLENKHRSKMAMDQVPVSSWKVDCISPVTRGNLPANDYVCNDIRGLFFSMVFMQFHLNWWFALLFVQLLWKFWLEKDHPNCIDIWSTLICINGAVD